MPAPDDAPGYDIIHLEDCLSRLSQRGRDVVRLAYAEARSHREIAEQLATTEANARVLRHRTLIALRGCMSERMSWEQPAA
jgi:RNA polymerase sigma factor (sigma-70 family)